MRAMLAQSGLQVGETQSLSPEPASGAQALTVAMWQAQKPNQPEKENRNPV
jgi:hypothetical protein